MCWVKTTPEDKLRDEAEEALNDKYDGEVRQFYLTERDRVKSGDQNQCTVGKL